MKVVRIALVVVVAVLFSIWDASAGTGNDLPRFQQVSGTLFRGGQPTERGFQELKRRGIRTIVNLRVDDSERAIVESLGMKYVHIPIAMPGLSRPWKKIAVTDIAAFFQLLDSA